MIFNTDSSVTEPLLTKLDKYFLKHYNGADEAHQIDHPRKVYYEGVKLINSTILDLKVDEYEFMVACYVHDMFVAKNREEHHTLAGKFIRTNRDKLFKILTPVQRMVISDAVLEHRSSAGKTKFNSDLSLLLKTADDGPPDLTSMIKRSMKYHDGNAKGVLEHMIEKFGREGYNTYTSLAEDVYGGAIGKLFDDIDDLTVDEVNRINRI